MLRQSLCRFLSKVLPDDGHVPDRELLRRFARSQDHVAFELLFRRHADAAILDLDDQVLARLHILWKRGKLAAMEVHGDDAAAAAVVDDELDHLPVLEAADLPLRLVAADLLGAPLVVLSACHTGEGYAMEAGVIGLARAFQIAGATNTVMSLWAIDDVATAALMSSFMEALGTLPPAEAMRKASKQVRSEYPNPAVWAAFNVFGNQAGYRSRW